MGSSDVFIRLTTVRLERTNTKALGERLWGLLYHYHNTLYLMTRPWQLCTITYTRHGRLCVHVLMFTYMYVVVFFACAYIHVCVCVNTTYVLMYDYIYVIVCMSGLTMHT